MTAFREAIAAIPFAAQTSEATGLLAPIIRALGHIMYTVGALAEPRYTLTDEEAIVELQHAANHLSRSLTAVATAPVSTIAKSRVAAFIDAVNAAHAEYGDWPEDDRVRNLKDLADRAAALGSFFDFELAGIRGSDPGRTL